MKRIGLLLLALILQAALVLSGCSSTTTEGGGQSGNSGGKTTLTFWTFNELHVQFYEEAVKDWNEQHPDQQIQLKPNVYPYEEMHNKLLIALQSGVGAPDIADIEISKFANYLKGSNIPLAELDDLIQPEKDKFIQSRFDIYSKNGHNYGIDFHVGATVMYYNKEMMDQAGVNIDEIKTWADYAEAGKKVMAATGKPMTTVEVIDNWTFWPMIAQQESDMFDQSGQVTLDNETNIKTLKFLHEMVHGSKIAVPAPGGNHHKEEYYGFMNKGGAASVLMPMWYMGRFLEYMPDLKGKIVIRPMPSWEPGGKRSAGMGGTGTVVTKQSKQLELAKQFLGYAKLSKEGNIRVWKTMGFDPIRWDVWDAPEIKEKNKYTDYFGEGIFDVLLEIKDEITPVNITEKTPQAIDLIRKDVLFKPLKENSMTPEDALKKAADELRK